jgi:hypothetical protein
MRDTVLSPAPLAAPARVCGFTDGQLEALKWVALASMFLDHIGRLALGHGMDGWVFAGGRLAFPLFALVLGINLARVGPRRTRAARTALRLGIWCAVAIVPSIWARGEPQVLNVLGTLGLGALLCALMADSSTNQAPRLSVVVRLALAGLALTAAPHVEFGLAGVVLAPAVYLATTGRLALGAVLTAASLGMTAQLNADFGGWPALVGTLAAVPLAWGAQRLPLHVPRLRQSFYVIYPLHLALIGAWVTWP